MFDTPPDSERVRLLELLRDYGWNATSFQLLDPDFCYWFDRGDACVAYVDTGGAWVVAGSPVAAIERMRAVAAGFLAHAARHRRRVVFFGVEERFLQVIGLRSVQIGEQPWWDPEEWRPRRSLREQFRRARAKGIRIERADSAAIAGDRKMRDAIGGVIRRWLESRPMPPMAFLVDLNPFRFAEERRFYVATYGEPHPDGRTLAAVLVAAPVYLRSGWFVEDIVRDPSAPNGSAEALVDFAMRDIAAEGSRFVTLGLAPLSGTALWLRLLRKSMAGFYNFEGLRAFKAKLRPTAWDPIYLAIPDGHSFILAVHDVLAAFAKGHLFRFAFRALFKAPAAVLQALALLLPPWIAVLATVDARWFPSPAVRLAWIAFDAAISVALYSLGRCWRRPVARIALAGVTLDVLLTLLQVATFNAQRIRGWADVIVIGVSLAAPLFTAMVLAGGLARRK